MTLVDLLSFLSRSPEKQIARARKKAREPHGDASVRCGACQKLAEMGSVEAIRALLDRFTINVSPSVQDEQEKEQVLAWVVQSGRTALPAIEEFVKTERTIYWPLRALREIVPEAEFSDRLDEILEFFSTHPPASPEPVVQLIRALHGLSSEHLWSTVVQFLEDPDDDVVIAATDFLFEGNQEDGRKPVLECYLAGEDRPRIRSHILHRLAEKDWTVKGFRPAVEECLPEGYILTRDGRIRRMGSHTGF